MLRRLRTTSSIILHHPRSLTMEQTRSAWKSYLAGRRRHHRIWLAIDLLISPLSVILTPIPGPNVIGYWFVYRSICHALALIGVRRASGPGMITLLHASEALDELIGGEQVASIGEQLGLRRLEDFLCQVETKRIRPDDPSVSGPP
ncbi:hypothetical protein P12x_003327 [Tundrisphaera lichenicola]|uniref:hypothetical protein n=1 Tax=Tundrisphaera lichenicola TaxID=2029860 RepID=UPI003EB6E7CC